MDIDRNTIIGLILIGLVIAFTYSDFYKKMVYDGQVPPPGPVKEQTQSAAPTVAKRPMSLKKKFLRRLLLKNG